MARTVLVIDDDPVGGALMEGRLTKSGFSVVRALNGVQALTVAAKTRPQLIILDIEMPEMNGYTFLGELRKDPDLGKIPVIVLTAHEENRSIFARKGIAHYLVKPVNFDLLFARMAEILPQG